MIYKYVFKNLRNKMLRFNLLTFLSFSISTFAFSLTFCCIADIGSYHLIFYALTTATYSGACIDQSHLRYRWCIYLHLGTHWFGSLDSFTLPASPGWSVLRSLPCQILSSVAHHGPAKICHRRTSSTTARISNS